MNADTQRSIKEILARGYYLRSQTMGEGGWSAIRKDTANWKSYWLSAKDPDGAHFDDSIVAKDDKAAKAAFASIYRLAELPYYSIQEVTTSYREIAVETR